MATTANPRPGAHSLEGLNNTDPFVTNPRDAQRQRYSAFDNSQFSLYLNASPAQAKRALEAHLSETVRRLQETSHLGTALVQQRKALEEKLQEVQEQEGDADIGPELRQRLAELEKEFNEVGRETARAFLPKSRVPSGEADAVAGASVYSSEALHSPSKVSVPSRKQRNQQPSRINDVQLATDISTSLLSQLKDLQAVLLEKDEALRASDLDRSQLEIERDGLSQRLRTIDESESRLKDVNWNLETQVREFEAQAKAAADRENRLNHNLKLAQTEKSKLEREFEELKQLHSKLSDEQATRTKHHETELSGLRRNVSMGETERGALQRKVEELAAQNQELAKAVAYRARADEQSTAEDTAPEDGAEEGDTLTPEHSPPPSPSKATPRHGQLESETLKHSLHHAHRMIQQLKNNIHREKTEKIELKRMLQDARDELETNRNNHNAPGSAGKRRKTDKDIFKKPARPDRLGALRTGSQEIVVDDDEWEEQDVVQSTPSRRPRPVDSVPGAFPGGFSSAAETSTDDFETANETSDAFETANERDETSAETDAFQTGAETLDGDSSDDLTETEAGPSTARPRSARPSSLNLASDRDSYQSTASTSGDEDDDLDIRTPVQTQQPRYRLKLRQGGYRRSTPRAGQDVYASTPPVPKDSPASFVSHSNNSTPAQGRSLFAELGNLSGESEDGSVADDTPSRTSVLSPESSPELTRRSVLEKSPLQEAMLRKPVMVDSAMMTETWPPSAPSPEPEEPKQVTAVSHMSTSTEPETHKPLEVSVITSQNTHPVVEPVPMPSLHMSSLSSQDIVPVSPAVPVIPPPVLNISTLSVQGTEPVHPVAPRLGVSTVSAQVTDPVHPLSPRLGVSAVSAQVTEPVHPAAPHLGVSYLAHQSTEPIEPTAREQVSVAPLLLSSVSNQATEPSAPLEQAETSRALPTEETANYPLQHMSAVQSQNTEPVEVPRQKLVHVPPFSAQVTEPVAPPRPTPPQISAVTSQSTLPVQGPRPALPQLSALSSQVTEPVEPLPQAQFHVPAITTHHMEPISPVIAAPPKHRFSEVMVLQDSQPESPTLPAFLPSPSRPSTANRVPVVDLTFSDISAQDTQPQEPSRPVTAHRTEPAMIFTSTSSAQTEDRKDAPEASRLGFFSSARHWNKDTTEMPETSKTPVSDDKGTGSPLVPIPSNAAQSDRGFGSTMATSVKPLNTLMTDEGTQTMVSADQIDKLLQARLHRHSGSIASAGVEKQLSPPASPRRSSLEPNKGPRRPGSSGSMRSRAASPPPLPPDHKEVIAAAALRSATPTNTTPAIMGPPTMPASAYKKPPQTPTIKTNVTASPKTSGTTPRPRYSVARSDTGRSGASSPITRRSSVSSFVSEVEQRFNIPANPFDQPGFDPNTTDPRMIKAITQTMIGEFLWKYTRKAGREGMSENRHRRFFWVHPYTRTLYWSDQDPQMAGRQQLKAKSVAIEAVQVVADDNPYPPGLHRKSLVVLTPGRSIKFTATTGQRHETWFNALSYLLLKQDGDAEEEKVAPTEIQNEFNPAFRSISRQTGRSRASLSSHMSRPTSSANHAQIPTLRSAATPHQPSTQEGTGSVSGRLSSLSGVFRSSFSSRRSRYSTMDATAIEDVGNQRSAEDLARQMIEQREREAEMDRFEMENVRACCDGKHDVGSLHHHSHKGRHGAHSRASLAGSMSSRSHSRAESHARRSYNDSHLHHQNELEASNSGAGF